MALITTDVGQETLGVLPKQTDEFARAVFDIVIMDMLSDHDATHADILDGFYLISFMNRLEGTWQAVKLLGHFTDYNEMSLLQD